MSGGVSHWAYPWGLHDIGLDLANERKRGAGVNRGSLATSSRTGRFLQPGNPRRVCLPEDGHVCCRPDPAIRTGQDIRPLMAEVVGRESSRTGAPCTRSRSMIVTHRHGTIG